MKNKHTGFLCIVMCVVLVASVFTACSVKDDDVTTTVAPATAGNWQNDVPEEPSYSKVLIEGVELADIISGALGEEYRDTSMDELTEEEKDKVKDYASEQGYIVEEDNGKINIYESNETEAPSELVNDIYEQASIKDPSNLTPEEITRLSQVAASNNVQLVTKDNGEVQLVTRVPATKVVTVKPTNKVTSPPYTANPNDYKTTIKVEIPSYNKPTAGYVSPLGTTLPKTKLAKAGWLKTYGDNSHHVFTNNATTSDGGIVAVGATLSVDGEGRSTGFGAIVAKYDKNGKLEWHDKITANKLCQLENVAVLKDGSIVAVGYTSGTEVDDVSPDAFKCAGSVEGLVIKYSKDGKKLFSKMYGGAGADMLYAVAPTSDGGFMIGGKSDSSDADMKDVGTNKCKAFVMKLDANGSIAWTNALSASLHASVKNIAVASNGTAYATIETVANDGDFASIQGTSKGLETTVLMKLNSNGSIAWTKCFHGSGRTQLYAVIATSDGGCVVAGQYASGVSGNAGTFADVYNGGSQGTFDGALIKIAADGTQKWLKTLVGFQNDFISDITAVPGGFALSGYTNSTNRDFSFANNGEVDSFVYIVSSYGDLQTVSSFGGSSVDNARGICSSGKTVYVCGFTNSADGSFKNCEVKGADGKGAALVYQFNLETT